MKNNFLVCCAAVALSLGAPLEGRAAVFDVKAFGAKADGTTPDRDAINQAIDAAAAAGGGTVYFPAGTYLTGSIRLRSNIALQLDPGCVIKASKDTSTIDQTMSALIWGIGLENVSIVGSGLITGTDVLTRQKAPGTLNGDRAIGLKRCRNVTLRDFSVADGGHSAITVLEMDNLTIDNVKVDTIRDGIDVGGTNIRISNTSVNSPIDDGICLKSDRDQGIAYTCENITITNCLVSGYEVGSLLDGTYKRTFKLAPDRDGATGRIKMGTGSAGGFKNITISNVVFDCCRGLALECVDGGQLEDITISNITMRDITNSPIFIRLGSRMMWATEGTPIGTARRISISNVVVYNADPRYPSIITGIPGHDVEDIKLSDIRIFSRGGLTMDQVAKQPADLINTFFFVLGGRRGGRGSVVPTREPFDTPEQEKEYPEPSMFGLLPAYGFFIRHAKGIELNNVEVRFMQEDRRPAFVLDDVSGADFQHVKAQKAADVPTIVLKNVKDFTARDCTPLPDTKIPNVDRREM
jgi:polygalacturonase